ncbi:MAG: hypothetical protein JWP73_192 [Phenylobacterium sp.]|nr:hypothetical protein [Phenylobacterium sp.]
MQAGRILFAALAAAASAGAASAQALPPEIAVMVAGDSWNRTLPRDLAIAAHAYDDAQVKSDKPALQRLLADDYFLANSSGQLEGKAAFIADQTAPGYRLEPFKVEGPINKVMGDVALLGGVATLTGTDSGKPYSVRLRFVDVWVKRKGHWQVLFTQATRDPAA